MQRNRMIPWMVVLLAALPLAAVAQDATPPHQHGAMMQSEENAPMMHSCKEMMAHHQQMREQMAASDAALDQRVAEMKSATGEAKVAATAAVVEELVQQHKAMHGMMMQHQPMMMGKMMEHMGAGDGMTDCPMMQHMKGDDEEQPASGDEHSEHHPE